MLILIAEDDPKLGRLLGQLLKKDGYQVDLAVDGQEALDFITTIKYDIVILDWMMPRMSGLEVCQHLRRDGFSGGILMLTAKDQVENRISGLDAGADDYLVKPFAYDELLARIRSIARRYRLPIISNEIEFNGIHLDLTNHTLIFRKNTIILSAKEFLLVEVLFRNRGQAVPRSQLIDRAWGIDGGEITDNNLDAFIRLIRKKIIGIPCRIVSVRSVGYRLEAGDVS